MKKYLALIVMVLVAVFFSVTCEQSTSPNKYPVITSHASLPRPFSNSTYFIFGEKLANGEQPILDNLENKNFSLQDAWVPDSFGVCMGVIRSEMVVRLISPDSSIYSQGFTSDSTKFSDYCIITWKHYHYL